MLLGVLCHADKPLDTWPEHRRALWHSCETGPQVHMCPYILRDVLSSQRSSPPPVKDRVLIYTPESKEAIVCEFVLLSKEITSALACERTTSMSRMSPLSNATL